MKVHFIERFTQPGETISLYKNGAFTDFCRGPHVPSTGRVKAFKVTSIAGAYWLGDEKNQQLQRIYGTAFFNTKDLDAHFKRLEEIKARDHRVLGKQLDLFSIQEVAGAGLIFWHPKGGLIRKTMEDWMRDECVRRGYEMVYTPHIMRRELWKISGHEENYGENMYPPMELDDAEYRLKPMNCPGHILIYKNTPRSYRDLPQRYAELGNVYRYERSGTMHGLLRVRGFTQDDAHIFCTPEQIESEIAGCIDFAESVLKTFGFAEFKVELSTWDPADKKFIGSAEKWDGAVGSLTKVLDAKGIPYRTIPGEAAFYGPKIDIKLVDVLGRMWQLSTVQFDWNLPARFDAPAGPSASALICPRSGCIQRAPRLAGGCTRSQKATMFDFAPGRFAPGTEPGDRLLAHELAHVAQQHRSGAFAPEIAAELDADAAAEMILHGGTPHIRASVGAPAPLRGMGAPGTRRRLRWRTTQDPAA